MVKLSPNKLLVYLKQRCQNNWLTEYDNQRFYELTINYYQQFQKYQPDSILLAETDNFKFLACFLAAVAGNFPLFLGNPYWQQREWQQVFELISPCLIIADNITGSKLGKISMEQKKLFPFVNPKNINNLIMIPTGGTSGKVKFTIHTWETLTASVQGFQAYFKIENIYSYCILPLYHVSGLMQFLRSFLSGGKLIISDYNHLKVNCQKLDSNPVLEDYFISLVPTQLQLFLSKNPSWLKQFKTILLGGAPAWRDLLETTRKYQIPLSITYGMTETASQVVTLKPEDFLTGNHSVGQVLPHAQIRIYAVNNPQLVIKAKSLFLGYYPDYNSCLQKDGLMTDDLGEFDQDEYLYILGRNSQKIITGGEKVFPREVEAAILETGLVKDITVIGVPDSQWGEAVTAIYVPKEKNLQAEEIKLKIKDKIAHYKQPRTWICVPEIPRNHQGKIEVLKINYIANNKQILNQKE